jgi:CTP synthase
LNQNARVEIDWLHSVHLEEGIGWDVLRAADGILVPGGFGDRGIEGKILAIQYARENLVPYLGLCLGMQLMVVEFARMILQDPKANSTEFDPASAHPVIDLLPEQRGITDKGGTMRLGLYPCQLVKGTKAQHAYGTDQVLERHRHRYEVNNIYRPQLESAGMIFSGQSPDGILAEIAELRDHPFMLASQFHPEFLSRPNRPHPLFSAFITAAIAASVEKGTE